MMHYNYSSGPKIGNKINIVDPPNEPKIGNNTTIVYPPDPPNIDDPPASNVLYDGPYPKAINIWIRSHKDIMVRGDLHEHPISSIDGIIGLPILVTTDTDITSLVGLFNEITLLVDTSSGNKNIQFPSSIGTESRKVNVKKIDKTSNIITNLPFNGETLEGSSSIQMNIPGESLTFQSTGSPNFWEII